MKPTARTSLREEEDRERAVLMTVGMMMREREGMVVVVGEFFRMDTGWWIVVL